MSELIDLPAGVLERIISMLDTDTIKGLRLTCRKLSRFTSQVLFRVISLYDTPKSCRYLQSILAQPHLRKEVIKLSLNTVEDDYDTDEEDEIEPPQGWEEILRNLSSLPNLQSVALRFDKKCAYEVDCPYTYAPQTEEYRATLLRWLFAGLIDLPRPLKELAIQNHQNLTPISRNVSNWMDEVLGTLETLRLNVVHERDFAAPESEMEKEPVHDFYNRVLRWTWLKPCMSSLRKLSLYSSHQWGFYPKIDLEDIHFPNLQSLTLGNFSFCEDKQLNWILAHSSTLEELHMDRCFIVFYVRIPENEEILEDILARTPLMESDMESAPEHPGCLVYHYPRRWHDYFTSIQNGLPQLSRFGFGNSPSWEKNRYLPFVGDFIFFPFNIPPGIEWPECDQQDQAALEALHRVTGQRADFG
ncbi:hypothetical protein PMG11_05980 [Penicillium brasilianum]|uniref:F-box domain-containing protein n=1 Tax=Penicillium brasilianum TaxID=104259 RepID=A0A0F7TQL3_PENBI|nr:hypothetical protein PMG11_05980 [Penicillium brasilianum]